MGLQMIILDNIWILGSLVVFIVIFIAIWKFDALSYIYDIRISNDKIDFILLSFFKVYTLYFTNIEYVKKTKGGYSYLFVFNFKNRLFHTTFFIKKKKGWFTKQLLVTPYDANQFVNLLKIAGIEVINTI